MKTVENPDTNDFVIIGFGTVGQEAALRTAGAERVLRHPRDLAALIELAGVTLRPQDTLLMVQPSLLKAADYKDLYEACAGGLMFQVVGHDPFPLSSQKHFGEFRKLKARGIETEAVQLTGRPRSVATYSEEQAEAIIRLWHEKPKRKPAEIVCLAKAILGLPDDHPMKPSWVRDLVIKYVGSGARDKPDHWNGLQK
ncbi:MAG: hypothetical protein ABJO67_04150 [Pseudoruegeria sp.]